MDENVQTMVHYLQQTLDPNPATRKEAEKFLESVEHNEGFLMILVNTMMTDSLDRGVRQAAAITFKNVVKRRWASEENSLAQSDKEQIKTQIISIMLNTPQYVQKQICEAIARIAKSDFPEHWQQLLPSLIEHLQGTDFNAIKGVLRAADPIFWKYRYEERSDELWIEIKYVIDTLAQPLTTLFGNCVKAVEQLASEPAQLVPVLEATELVLQIFYSLNFQDLPAFFEDHMEEWMHGFLTLLKLPNMPELDDDDLEKPGVVQQVKGQICACISLYAQKYDEEFQIYLRQFVDVVWHLLTTTGLEVKNDYLVSTAMNFLTSVSERKQNMDLFSDEAVLKAICEQVIVPNMYFREADEEIFEDNAEEYIRRDIEGSDVDTRRRAACDLVRGLCKFFESQVTDIFSAHVSTLIETYQADPVNNWKSKDVAIFLVTSLAVRSKTASAGTTETNQFINVEDFFHNVIVAHLKPDAGSHPVLVADAIKYVLTFRGHLAHETNAGVLPYLIHHLSSPICVVNSYAAACIERQLVSRRQGALLLPVDVVTPHLESLLTNLFHALSVPGNGENEYVMKAIMRTIVACKAAILPYIVTIVDKLAAILLEVAKNPGRPRFNHFMFEAFGSAIRFSCSTSHEILEKFEAALFPPFELLLTNDVEEFQPYIFQLLAQLLELRQPPVPDTYMSLFPHLTNPGLWESGANTTPLVRFLCAFFKVGKTTVVSGTAEIEGLLGVFQKLIASKAHDQDGFKLLTAMVANLPYEMLAPYMETVMRLMLARMTGSRTAKFTSNFITFVCFLTGVRDPNTVAQIFDAIQPGLFGMVLNRIMEDVRKVSGDAERKACVIGITQMLCASNTVMSQPELWAKLLETLVSVIELPEEEHPDEFDVEEPVADASGYRTATFNRLAYAGQPDEDYFKEVSDVRTFVAQHLGSCFSQHQNLKAAIPANVQQPLSSYFQAAGVALA
ncbi:cellular apoptosis susceptibility protein [Salpingoeca rosetta]|uniref:Cellular apoptosis susceptibility protein n=1 Tax=Salpingoeca rosetta (strain ATCC 50818 / BSB-021) TaxID=946362 RepID=F2U796_SALR5|nr:cellular apoptosis susceptibility protein [Salpingoeca rosetta]EGD83313.1 cellular apoptosis susceptibility protein [Salpingoeca rosetta]|eukprot:XP_004994817.1 cellular apoptosis susceptibility protein [Salpingoeca rosetta]